MKLVKLEFYKCRRRKVLLVCAAVVAVELLWFGAYLARQDRADLQQGWMLLFYNLALVDAIVLPISVAALASRNCELEHKGTTLKLLETAVTPGQLYTAKLIWGALVLAAMLVVRSALFLGMGVQAGFPDAVPWGYYGLMSLSRMQWDEVTRYTEFFWRWPLTLDVALLCLWGMLFLLVGRTLFVRKEV